MNSNNIWYRAKQVLIQTTDNINSGFDIGFDDNVSEEVEVELKNFVSWVERNFNMPIVLWVDFEYKHYLKDRNGNKVGFLFYWEDFKKYPAFENIDDIPEIRLPVRIEKSTIEEVLGSFIEAITCYFAWICNEITEDYSPNENDVEEILAEYLNTK